MLLVGFLQHDFLCFCDSIPYLEGTGKWWVLSREAGLTFSYQNFARGILGDFANA